MLCGAEGREAQEDWASTPAATHQSKERQLPITVLIYCPDPSNCQDQGKVGAAPALPQPEHRSEVTTASLSFSLNFFFLFICATFKFWRANTLLIRYERVV